MELSSWSDNFRMMSTRDLFYGKNEPTFILKNIKGVPPRPEMVLSSVPFYPSVAQNDDKGKKGAEEKKKDPDVVLYVPMCCRECEDRVKCRTIFKKSAIWNDD
ncbi:hypothetical protein R1sor_020421 [Riccia sorocarpa]|uniref:Uncharacterized protein n=1 Tax=Riccia sorocarpa TaxID=122646 RepID=A0ABD3IH06_9MARC